MEFSILGMLLVFALAGCETDGGLSARKREKESLYASLKPWEKLKVDNGTPGLGFSRDMVYLAMGSPSKIERESGASDRTELWIYDRFFPLIDASHGFNYRTFTIEPFAEKKSIDAFDASQETVGRMSGNGLRAGNGPSAVKTGAPMGDAVEPPDLRSFKCLVLFKDGKVASLRAIPNVN